MPVMPSPAVLRAARVLSELAARPDEDVTLSDLARRLGINKTSCQTLLLALVEEGLVERRPERTYRLGSRLIHLGEAAKASLRLPELVQPELDDLSAELGATSTCLTRAGTDVVVVGVSEVADHLGFTVPLGKRIPLRPPFGAVYLAWDSPAEVEAWLARAEPGTPPSTLAEARRALEVIRARGASVTVRRPGSPRTIGARSGTGRPSLVTEPGSLNMEYLAGAGPAGGRGTAVGPGDGTSAWTVVGVGAPVFDRDGMRCTLSVAGLPFALDHDEICRVAERVRQVADGVTARIGGRMPPGA